MKEKIEIENKIVANTKMKYICLPIDNETKQLFKIVNHSSCKYELKYEKMPSTKSIHFEHTILNRHQDTN